jgi:hypothetical protein
MSRDEGRLVEQREANGHANGERCEVDRRETSMSERRAVRPASREP